MSALTLADLFSCESEDGVVFAYDQANNLVHVDNVPRGKACGCYCVGCGRPLIARQGDLRAHTFAHESDAKSPACATAGETALHKIAKDYLAEALTLSLPDHFVEEGDLTEQTIKHKSFTFDRAEAEQALPGMRSDVLVHKKDRRLLVEFKVTHACGDEKIRRIQELDIAAVEIDLASYRGKLLEELRQPILHDAPRTWLHNPKDKEVTARLRNRIRERDEADKADAERRIKAYVVPTSSALARVTADNGLGNAVDQTINGAGCFSVPPDQWQSTTLIELYRADLPCKSAKILSTLGRKGMLREEFINVPERIRTILGDRVTLPDEAVETFLVRARNRGWVAHGRGAWTCSSKLIATVKEAAALRERPVIRRKQLNEAVQSVFEFVPQSDREDFDPNIWWENELPALGRSPSAALLLDDTEWDEFINTLSDLKSNLRFRPDQIHDTLGLPIAAEKDRLIDKRLREAEERERARVLRLAAEAETRVQEITKEAAEAFGSQSGQFLQTKIDFLGQLSPIEASRSSYDLHTKALLILRNRREQKRNERFSDSMRIAAQDKLEAQALRLLGHYEAAAKWMESDNPYLGGRSPRVYCTSKARLESCQEALRALLPRGNFSS